MQPRLVCNAGAGCQCMDVCSRWSAVAVRRLPSVCVPICVIHSYVCMDLCKYVSYPPYIHTHIHYAIENPQLPQKRWDPGEKTRNSASQRTHFAHPVPPRYPSVGAANEAKTAGGTVCVERKGNTECCVAGGAIGRGLELRMPPLQWVCTDRHMYIHIHTCRLYPKFIATASTHRLSSLCAYIRTYVHTQVCMNPRRPHNIPSPTTRTHRIPASSAIGDRESAPYDRCNGDARAGAARPGSKYVHMYIHTHTRMYGFRLEPCVCALPPWPE